MNIKKVVVGNLRTNCYILEIDDECLVIDPGDEFDKIEKSIDKNLVGVLITHKHFDHIGAKNEMLNHYKVECYDNNNLIEGINTINNFNFEVIYNPGHTMDSISFIFKDSMFSGDFIFEGTIGRCDLGGDFELMKDSIRNILKKDVNYKIYPGHGNYTFLNDERINLENWLK